MYVYWKPLRPPAVGETHQKEAEVLVKEHSPGQPRAEQGRTEGINTLTSQKPPTLRLSDSASHWWNKSESRK